MILVLEFSGKDFKRTTADTPLLASVANAQIETGDVIEFQHKGKQAVMLLYRPTLRAEDGALGRYVAAHASTSLVQFSSDIAADIAFACISHTLS